MTKRNQELILSNRVDTCADGEEVAGLGNAEAGVGVLHINGDVVTAGRHERHGAVRGGVGYGGCAEREVVGDHAMQIVDLDIHCRLIAST